MKELSLHLLDIAENALRAGATLIRLELLDRQGWRSLTVEDNGRGMSPALLRRAPSPFCTTRTTRSVGLGLPLLRHTAEQTGGFLDMESRWAAAFPDTHGTRVQAVLCAEHIDCPPLGDITATLLTLIQGNPTVDFLFAHRREREGPVTLDTRRLRSVLEPVPLNEPAVLRWIGESLREQYGEADE